MYRGLVLFAVFALASARVSILSVEFERAFRNNLLDFNSDEDKSWPFLQRRNATTPAEQSNEVGDLFTFAQLTAVSSKGNVEKTRQYTFGKRVDHDGVVGYSSDVKTWSTPQDVTLDLKYPESGQGAKLTYIQIIVGQSSDIGEAKITGGGIGEHSVAIVVTAKQTTFFTYVVYYYGI